MTTATRRLRRASVAGLATIATTAVVVATAGSALAFSATGTGTVTRGTGAAIATVYPGVATQALPEVDVTLNDASGAGWAAGDFITFNVASNAAGAELCNTASNLNLSASLSTVPTVTGTTNTSTAFTGFSPVTQSSGANCNAKDVFTLVFTAGAPADANNTVFAITNLNLSLGSAIAPAATVFLNALTSNGSPFTGNVNHASVQVGTVGATQVSVGTAAAGSSGSAQTLAIPSITVKDVVGGSVATNLNFTLPSAQETWATNGTLSVPAGVTAGTATVVGQVLTYPISGTVPAGGTFVLSGATVAFTATAPAGLQLVTVKTAATTLGTPAVAFLGGLPRIGGADRYASSALLYNDQFSTATSVVLASGANYPDALSATYLAGTFGTGVLLTDPNVLQASTQTVLINNHITTVYIVGGTAAVSQAVQNQISALHVGNNPGNNALLNVIRVSGADRYATNEAADLFNGVSGSTGGTGLLATGTNFADALAAGPASYGGKPILLTDPSTLSPTATATIKALGITNVVILGGTSAVSAADETAVKAISGVTVSNRIAGADRTGTAAQIATWELTLTGTTFAETGYAGGAGLGFSGTTIWLSRGDTFPDALSAGANLGHRHNALLLTTSPTTLGAGAATVLNGSIAAHSTNSVGAIGLNAALSSGVQIQALAQVN